MRCLALDGRELGCAEATRDREVEEQGERWEQDDAAANNGDDQADERVVAGGCLVHSEVREDRGPARERPAGRDRGDGKRGAIARRLVTAMTPRAVAQIERLRRTLAAC